MANKCENRSRARFQDKVLIRIIQDYVPSSKITKEADLRSPTPEHLCEVYRGLCSYMDLDAMKGLETQHFKSLKYPDMHQGFMELGFLATCLCYIFQSIKCSHHFQISDLINPSPQRTRIFLNELCNFLLYSQDSFQQLNEGSEMRKNAASRIEELRKKRDELKNQVAAALEERGQREDKVKDFDKRMAATVSNSKQLTDEITQLQDTQAEMEADHEELAERVNKRLRDKESKMTKMRTVQSHIVSSPDKVRKELNLQREAENAMKTKWTEKEAILHERKRLEKLMVTTLSDATDLSDYSQQAVKLVKSKKLIRGDIESVRNDRKQLHQKSKVLEEDLCNKKSQSKTVAERQSSVQMTNKNKVQQMSQKLSSYLQERERLEDLADATEQRLEELQTEEEELQQDKTAAAKYVENANQLLQQIIQTGVLDFEREMMAELEKNMKK